MTIELNPTDEQEAATARWKALLNDAEFMAALLEGVPKRPEGWWKEPAECPVCWMFEMFPLSQLQ